MQEETIQPEPPAKKPQTDWDALLKDFDAAAAGFKNVEKAKDAGGTDADQVIALAEGVTNAGGADAIKKLEKTLSTKATPLKETIAKPSKTASVKTIK